MMYLLIFINNDQLTLKECQDYINHNIGFNETQKLSQSKIDQLVKEISDAGLKFTAHPLKENTGLHLLINDISVLMAHSEVYIDVPYYVENFAGKISEDVKKVIQILGNHQMTGYNTQSELLSDKFELVKDFNKNKAKHLGAKEPEEITRAKKELKRTKRTVFWVKLLVYTSVTIFLAWMVIRIIKAS